jgi:hypothetical protein
VDANSTGLPYLNDNVPGEVVVPPVSVPQLSVGIRFADRVNPRPEKYTGLERWSDPVRDHMADERWDIEFDWIYYFNSFHDTQDAYFSKDQRITRVLEKADGTREIMSGAPGECSGERDQDGNCLARYFMPTKLGGIDQMTMRLGGDYNVILNVLALRAGLSYQGRGVEPEYALPTSTLPFERLGVHAGFTWRIDGRTDFSFAYAHFFQETIRLAVNEEAGGPIDKYLAESQNFGPAQGKSDEEVREMYHVVDPDEADGFAKQRRGDNFYFVNAGTHTFNLDVWGVSIARHF